MFVTALAYRHAERDHEFHVDMHDFIEQIERLAMMGVLILFGGALVSGLLSSLRPVDVAVALVIVFVVRPLAGLIGFIGWKRPTREKLILAFFGIRGIGSFYYLAYGLNEATFAGTDRLWSIVGLICLISILLHGITVTPVMRWLDRSQGRDPDAEAAAHAKTATRATPGRDPTADRSETSPASTGAG